MKLVFQIGFELNYETAKNALLVLTMRGIPSCLPNSTNEERNSLRKTEQNDSWNWPSAMGAYVLGQNWHGLFSTLATIIVVGASTVMCSAKFDGHNYPKGRG